MNGFHERSDRVRVPEQGSIVIISPRARIVMKATWRIRGQEATFRGGTFDNDDRGLIGAVDESALSFEFLRGDTLVATATGFMEALTIDGIRFRGSLALNTVRAE